MTALGAVAGGLVSRLWQVAAIVLAGLLLAVVGAAGTGLWLTAAARDQALADLRAEQGRAEELRGSIREQNRATDVLARAKADAEARGQAAQVAAAAASRRYDAALAGMSGARVTTCADAMPYVNKLLEDVR